MGKDFDDSSTQKERMNNVKIIFYVQRKMKNRLIVPSFIYLRQVFYGSCFFRHLEWFCVAFYSQKNPPQLGMDLL